MPRLTPLRPTPPSTPPQVLPSLVSAAGGSLEWLLRQRPHMLSCPRCTKPLPRCVLCLMTTCCLNPSMQLQHELAARHASGAEQQQGAGASHPLHLHHHLLHHAPPAPGAGEEGDAAPPPPPPPLLFDLRPRGHLRDAMPRGELMAWCQSCRHGGHAGHLAEWFASGRTVCPAAGCMCQCGLMDRRDAPMAITAEARAAMCE